ncbi:hypothetical protein Hypma_007899 [Hypsizygus marmoreus]|uniref:Uncharacterized protein n=1 Tax=Hypsizygus marmoreus TaxID=39966 RepID=A0A369JWV8_HYPMA|nr:hypothetical protein Hypma_007899 [Hypsizygus marmoreus]
MKFTTRTLLAFFTTLASSLTMLSFTNALPIEARDVFVPRILTPTDGEIWLVGQLHTITWNVTNAPAQITNPVGKIMLRKGNRTLNVTLAENFDILSGITTVTVPDVCPGHDYRVVLFGDSGNWGPEFSIIMAGYGALEEPMVKQDHISMITHDNVD